MGDGSQVTQQQKMTENKANFSTHVSTKRGPGSPGMRIYAASTCYTVYDKRGPYSKTELESADRTQPVAKKKV